MCGIFGYINYLEDRSQEEIINFLLNGLKRLEYRGYDSAGLAVGDSENIRIFRQVGKVSALEDLIKASAKDSKSKLYNNHCGIAHTRWATHGKPSPINCHPQRSDDENEFTVVHNGIITNYVAIKTVLEQKGYKFESDTDTEVFAKLLKYFADHNPDIGLTDIAKLAINEIEGAFALLIKGRDFPGEIVATRRGSPLLVGLKSERALKVDFVDVEFSDFSPNDLGSHGLLDNGKYSNSVHLPSLYPTQSRAFLSDDNRLTPIEYFFASDASAVIEHTKRVIYLEDNDIAHVCEGEFRIHRFRRQEGDKATRALENLELEIANVIKGNYDHYMQKEIFEQPESICNAMRGRINFSEKTIYLGGIRKYKNIIARSRRIIFIACGTSFHAALSTRDIFETLSGIPTYIESAGDFLDRKPVVYRDDSVFLVSQSGETADTLMALRYCREMGALCFGITNTVGSTISRMTQAGCHVNAGSEIAVASTKAYTSQFIVILLIALEIAANSRATQTLQNDIIDALEVLPSQVRKVLELADDIKALAKNLLADPISDNISKSMLLIGRGRQYATCLEGSLKIKEIGYIHAEAVSAGELKHGILALIDGKLPIFFLHTNETHTVRSQNALKQIQSRGGLPYLICTGTQDVDLTAIKQVIKIPKTHDTLQGVLDIIVFQLLSYNFGCLQGHDVDCPKNLAKSVTVE